MTGFVLFAAVGGLVYVSWISSPLVLIAGFASGALVAAAGRLRWRLQAPVMVLDHERRAALVPGSRRTVPFGDIDRIEYLSGPEVRGYLEHEIALIVVTGGGTPERIPVLNRNNFRDNPLNFHGTFLQAKFSELCLAMGAAAGLPTRCAEQRQRIAEGVPS